MDRRGFLKAIGLGGVALCLPKPLQLLAPLENQPLHFGRLLFPPLASGQAAFEMHGLSISPKYGISIAQFKDFYENWLLKVVWHEKGETKDLIHAPTPMVTHNRETRTPALPVFPSGMAFLFNNNQRLDCWLKPGCIPKYPMPEVDMVLQGRMHYHGEKKPTNYWMTGKFSTVRMDLDQAKKLSLVPANEIEDDFSEERPEEVAPQCNLLCGRS